MSEWLEEHPTWPWRGKLGGVSLPPFPQAFSLVGSSVAPLGTGASRDVVRVVALLRVFIAERLGRHALSLRAVARLAGTSLLCATAWD